MSHPKHKKEHSKMVENNRQRLDSKKQEGVMNDERGIQTGIVMDKTNSHPFDASLTFQRKPSQPQDTKNHKHHR